MNNEKGIIYPLAITVCLIILIFLGYLTGKISTERQFVYMQEEQYKQTRLLKQGVERAINDIKDASVLYPLEKNIVLNEGSVHLLIEKTTDEERLIVIEALTDKSHTKSVKVYYNVTQNSVTKWVEG
ncbi:competence type IV pilus minor pilin ComGG [Fictibacillus phosphorivorans]|uniref:competence type IV pilus minor pilin ComGG n=1 Tax=Fictibacillus phosphorivorans TaxID=1221500 RepID=UPI00203AEF86|nr:competence type IV pilus minor pilin ComGG [Fictibacillus phosphorivorans]MCM3716789.1 ComGG family competence protein [Fictibacillus phosphorivorans]MCM3774662.1 ComGG family competence protein [Fictibacillus phosphorivorans]